MKNKRAGAFFGLHFDYHAVDSTVGIGTKTTAKSVGDYLDRVKPDYIQVDTKGHPGYTSFMSDFGTRAPGLEVDYLKILRKETEKRGIALIAHYSGVYDACACTKNPEYAVIHKDGSRSTNCTTVTGKYADDIMIPQILELSEKYGLDGIWVDGDCWFTEANYDPEFLAAFYKESGFSQIEDAPDSPSKSAFTDYCRKRFIDYLQHYIKEVKKVNPHFEITSNWAFSTQMPEKPIDIIDYLSGDIIFQKNYTGDRMETRAFAFKGKPWDLMSWGMANCYTWGNGGFAPGSDRSIFSLEREAACVVSMGGGYQLDNIMTPKGEIRHAELAHMEILSQFVRARQPFCYHSKPLQNAAVFCSLYNLSRKQDSLYNFNRVEVSSAINMILDGGRPCDLVYDYEVIEDKLGDRKTLIIPEFCYISDKIYEKLNIFVKSGGNLILIGTKCCELFSEMLGASTTDKVTGLLYPEDKEYLFCQSITYILFKKDTAKDFIICHKDVQDYTAEKVSAAIINTYGSGKVIAFGWDLASEYDARQTFAVRNIIRNALDTLEPEPVACLESGLHKVDIIPAEKDGKLLINIINTAEIYAESMGATYDEIEPVYNLTIKIKTEKQPKAVMLQPEGISADYTFDGKFIHVHIQKLDIHTIIEVE